jgi:general secretion pathway protein G
MPARPSRPLSAPSPFASIPPHSRANTPPSAPPRLCARFPLCVASLAPARLALRAAFGRLPGQRPLARVPVSGFRSRLAFTLIELLVTITVIAILAGITLGAMGGVNQKATRDKTKAEIAAISNALEQYKSVNDSYPTAGGNSTVPFAATGATIRPFYIANKVQTNSSGQLQDPYGNAYKYKTPGDNNPASFDVWTTDSKGNTIGNW